MEIKQLQVGYNDAQDRLVLRINIDQDKFANLLITRRVCRFMLDQMGPFLKIAEPVSEKPGASDAASSSKPAKRSRKKTAELTAAVEPDRLKPSKFPEAIDPAHPAEHSAAKPDYKTPFEERGPEGNIFGAGSAWPVVVNAGCSLQDDKQNFTLQLENQQTMNLTLSQHLAKGLFRLMYDLAERIQWFAGISAVANDRSVTEEIASEPLVKSSVTYH